MNIPMEVLERELKLTAKQKAEIAPIQDQFRQAQRQVLPPPPEPGSPPPDLEAMRAGLEKLHAQQQQAGDRINEVLSSEQKQSLSLFLKGMKAMRAAGLPPPAYRDLKLTAEQKKRIAAIGESVPEPPGLRGPEAGRRDRSGANPPPPGPPDGFRELRQQTREKVMAVLTAEQRKSVEQFLRAHPRPEGGRGFGPPPGPPPEGFGPPEVGPRDE